MDTGAAVLLGTGLLALFAFLAYHGWSTRNRSRNLAARAAQRGWSFQPGSAPVLFQISGSVAGTPFTASQRRPAGVIGQNQGQAPTVTELTLPSPRLNGTVILHPDMRQAGLAALPQQLMGGLIHRVLFGQDHTLAEGLPDVTGTLGTALPAAYRVAASDPELAQRILTPQFGGMLADLAALHGPQRPITLVRSDAHTTLRILAAIDDLDRLEALARLATEAARPV